MVMLAAPEGRLTEQHDIFLESVLLKRINPTDEGFFPKPKDEFILMRGEVSLVDQFSITIEDRDTVVIQNYFY
jgi:hypothetical protein